MKQKQSPHPLGEPLHTRLQQKRETNTRTNDPQPQHPVQSGNMQKRKQTATYNVATRESQTVAHHTA